MDDGRFDRRGVWQTAGTSLAILGLVLLSACRGVGEDVRLELAITQSTELILHSHFGKPAQMAIWLEDPSSGRTRTLFVTECAGAGAWNGKVESPDSLPRWYRVWRAETGQDGYPRPEAPAPDGTTRPTPVAAEFLWTADLADDRRWVCWIEVNISGDFNEHFPQVDESTGYVDTDYAGQPSLLYRAELDGRSGSTVTPTLFGRTVPGTPGDTTTDLSGITSALEILNAIEIRLVPR